jgi:hypothetical protein
MGTLQQALQHLHEAGKPIEISWLWDGGVDVNAGGEGKTFRSVSDVTAVAAATGPSESPIMSTDEALVNNPQR